MKKILKILLIIIIFLVLFVAFDTIQALLLNRSPLIRIRESYSEHSNIILKTDKGLLVDTAYCANGDVKAYFKWKVYSCPLKDEEIPTN